MLVGLTGTGLTDMRTTALGELVPGIEIQAQGIETIFEGRFLRRPLWLQWAEIGFIVAFGLLADATSAFIILSAVIGSFFSTSVLAHETRNRPDDAHAHTSQDGDRTGSNAAG